MTDINRLKSLMEKVLLGELEVHQDEATGVFEIRTALDGDVDGDTGRHFIVGGDLIAIMADALRDVDRADLFCAAINALPFLLAQSERTEALEAEVERLNKWADGFSDAQLKERATAEAYQRELRVRLFAQRRVDRYDHSTACSIWGDDGQGNTHEGYSQPLPCNCGALENFQRDRAEAAEAQAAALEAELAGVKEENVALKARVAELEALFKDAKPLPEAFKYLDMDPGELEHIFDAGLRHKSNQKPYDYLKRWLPMFRPFAYATRDDSWGELEKLICIVMTNYVGLRALVLRARALTTNGGAG